MKKSIVLICTSLILLCGMLTFQKGFASADTVFVLSLEINMTKAVRSGIFNPSLDHLYAVFDTAMADQQLVNSGDNKFTLLLSQGLDSGAIYHFRFRINNFLTETVNRQILIQQGINYYSCWWNNDYLNYTWFQVDMSYLVQQHSFRPDTDYVDLVGNMNNWQGSPPLTRMGSAYIYQTMYNIEPGTTAVFKFRINGDTNRVELQGQPNRFLLAPDSVIHSLYWFNNYNPAKVPMQFYCNMKYMTRAGHFNRQYDHLDVAGSFNGNGACDILYDYDKDSIYTATVLIDTNYYNQNPINFKYRINSSWETAELQGKPFRTYVLHDTITGRNIDSSWFNNWNSSVPTRPFANNVNIQGNYIFKQVVSGVYFYENINGIKEGVSTYQWYRSADSLGISLTPIDTATHINFTIDTTCIHKWLVFEVTPIAVSGDSAIGRPVRVITKSSIGYVGIAEQGNLISLVYPNPSNGKVVVEGLSEIRRIELYDLTGRIVFITDGLNSRHTQINPDGLIPGLYILKAGGRFNETGWARIVRQ
ncbi:MAG: T9SS type A sorting domain-containing protein [Bacteroidetes bacterium]|nr:T9SS type A sorting domain-containing protein [Bacteroidota bacterium]